MTKKGVVLPLGTSGQIDDAITIGNGIIYKDGYFWLYYDAGDGSNERVGLALSKDGVNFTKKGVVVELGDNTHTDDVRAFGGSVIFKDGYFWIWYTGYDGVNGFTVNLALSSDGFTFTKKGAVIVPTAGAGDSRDCYWPSVMFHDGYFWCYYAGNNNSNTRVHLAVSTDGVNWIKKGVVIPLGQSTYYDDKHTDYPSPMYKDGYFYLYHTGYNNVTNQGQIALALSKDGINFTKKGIIIPLADSALTATHAYFSVPLYKDGMVYLYYSGTGSGGTRSMVAMSTDGVNF